MNLYLCTVRKLLAGGRSTVRAQYSGGWFRFDKGRMPGRRSSTVGSRRVRFGSRARTRKRRCTILAAISGIDTGKAFSLSGIGGTPCFRLSIQSWVYRSFHRYLYSIPIFLFSFASLSRLSFSAFSLSLSSIPSFLWLALRIDSPKSVDLITVRFESSSIGWIYMLRGDGKVGESWLWTERKKAVVFRWNRFIVSVFFPSLLVSAVRSLFLGYLDHQKG
ncbi:hypothetical protein DEO72_LG2g2291 [Vigna unguiculata]|uniref:Uncharacterized protein n=1 Tax=Vigna unguiculata TaxID=3917 RepID=A0A4D6L008_VIGUN|nr:hypothetical protein DEO72_LG2g2291 [Vigna unguiculata]